MFSALARTARRLLTDLNRSRLRTLPLEVNGWSLARKGPAQYLPLARVTITDGVSRTLFEEYAEHRAGPRGHEETGWLLLGLRETDEAVVLATLPAGTGSDASVAHVQFNSNGQALGARIVRQADRRLTILGVVHTHPGSLRHPSDGDYRGDSDWVGQLRGGEGIFGIGTADEDAGEDGLYARQPKPHVQCLGPLCLSWYALRDGDGDYRSLAHRLTLGPDLARPLHRVWTTIEAHAERLDRLCRQQASVKFDVVANEDEWALAVTVPLAERGDGVRVLLQDDEVRYYVARGEDLESVQSLEKRVDRGVYLLLAELAQRE
jgi:proteasome lid subunit RPN8/RPN11